MSQFEVQLDALDRVGGTHLPAVAKSIADAEAQLREAVGWITRTFDTRGKSYDEGPWNAEQPQEYYLFWRPGNECYYAMDLLRQVFQDNHENVQLAAQAIKEIALRYRQADGQA
ncbi:hypothetical protein [Actinophytocola sp. KF-1]